MKMVHDTYTLPDLIIVSVSKYDGEEDWKFSCTFRTHEQNRYNFEKLLDHWPQWDEVLQIREQGRTLVKKKFGKDVA